MDPPICVVIIDDSPDDRAEMKSALLRGSIHRYTFHEADTGRAGLALMEHLCTEGRRPDCVLLDFNLPDSDVFEVLAAMPREEREIALPVVVITGGVQVDDSRSLISAGAQDYVGKGWLNSESLTRAIQNARERHAMMARLRRSERRYREIVERMSEGLYVTAPDGRIELTNPALDRMLGYRTGELLGLRVPELFDDAERAAAAKRLSQRAADDDDVQSPGELQLRTRDGRDVWINARVTRMVDDLGAARGMLGIVTDVTEKRKLERKLLHAQKLESLGVLAGGVAHDFNNLLVSILGNAGLALADLPQESSARAELDAIQTAAVRASELTRQLLAYAGKGRFVSSRVDLGRLVGEMGSLLSAVVPKNVVLKYYFAVNLPTVEADPTQLRQVVMNLITNAAEAIGEKKSGIITVSTSMLFADRRYLADTYLDDALAPGYYVCLEVSDTGCGMTTETRLRIFDPFFTTKFTGRGLGLAAVLGILRAHRGAMKVYSEPGRGSTFKILLPASDAASDAKADATEKARDWRGSGTILVIDDEETVRSVSKRILERVGFTVLMAADGAEALELFKARRGEIRVVLLDVMMPKMAGEETFRQLRQIDPEVRVVLSSGYSEQEATSRFAGKGLAGFVEKPFKPQTLLDTMRAALEVPE